MVVLTRNTRVSAIGCRDARDNNYWKAPEPRGSDVKPALLREVVLLPILSLREHAGFSEFSLRADNPNDRAT